MNNWVGNRFNRILILSVLIISFTAPYEISEARIGNLPIQSSNFSFTTNHTLYDINNNGFYDTMELTLNINWVQNFTYDIRILINFNDNSISNTYIDHILEYHNANQPNIVTFNYRWFSIYQGDISVKISLFQVGEPEQEYSFVWESADKFQIQQEFNLNYEFSWNKNESNRNLDVYNLELILEWSNIVFTNSVEVNVYEFIIPSNRYILDQTTSQKSSVFGNGSSIFTINGIRNFQTNKLIQIEIISQDFEPILTEFLWEMFPETYTSYITKTLANTTSVSIDENIQTSDSIFTQSIFLSLVSISLVLTIIIIRKRK